MYSCSSCGSSLVPLEVFLQHKSCWSCRQLLYVTLFFISPLFICLFNLEFQNVVICSFCSFLCSFLLSIFFPSYSYLLFFLFPVLFSPSVYSLYFQNSVLFSFQICCPFFSLFLLLCSVCFSLMLYSYSICSLSSISLHL